ncbi:MAG: hypothetical protein KKA42_08340 [candidate division Zixibacteria bacterium]|nr:hypothetical protein [candidate division Zixibacteria bacterium]
MKRILVLNLIGLLIMGSVSFVHAEESDMVSINDLDWLVGHWVGDGFGGVCEETWNPVSGGTMLGMFKLTVDNQVRFYEIITITPDSTGPLMKVKHFNPDLTGWEEKDESVVFPFVSGGNRRAQFGGLTYERTDDSSLSITVTISHKDGTTSQQIINCKKMDD